MPKWRQATATIFWDSDMTRRHKANNFHRGERIIVNGRLIFAYNGVEILLLEYRCIQSNVTERTMCPEQSVLRIVRE